MAGTPPGQYLRLGIEVDGVHHWRAYSLTSEPRAPDGCIAITPKLVERRQGLAVPVRARAARGDRAPGRRRRHVRAARPAARAAAVHQRRQRHHADHEHAARARRAAGSCATSCTCTARARADGRHLRIASCARSASATRGYRLHLRITGEQGRLQPGAARRAVPRLARARDVPVRPGGPARGDRASAGAATADPQRLHVERFQPDAQRRRRRARRGRHDPLLRRAPSRRTATASSRSWSPARAPARACRSAAAWASATAASGGCASGQVRDLRTGRVHGQPGELLRTCINAPEGAVEIDL